MSMPIGVLGFYAALVLWVVLLAAGIRRRAFGAVLVYGVALMLVLNARYFIEGAPAGIAFFIGIYDVPMNLGAPDPATAAALATCPDNGCTVWGSRFVQHPSWGVAFHERFLHGDALRKGLLYGHIAFNSLAFVLMMVQLFRPGTGRRPQQHRRLGQASLLSLGAGVLCAVLLAAEHGSVAHYGASLSTYGFWFMGLCVCTCAAMGFVSIRRGDRAVHRTWMFRYAGSMWGAFWLFRVMEFVLGPLLREHDTASILICIWLSAPLGILIAELIRRRLDHGTEPAARPLGMAEAATR